MLQLRLETSGQVISSTGLCPGDVLCSAIETPPWEVVPRGRLEVEVGAGRAKPSTLKVPRLVGVE